MGIRSEVESDQDIVSSDAFLVDGSHSSPGGSTPIGRGSNSSLSLAQEETKAVNRSKYGVLFALVLTAIIIGTLAYVILTKQEHIAFQRQFQNFAMEVADLANHEARNMFMTLDAFSVSLTSFAIANHAHWPYIMIPHFELQGAKINQILETSHTFFCPLLVTNDDREGWNPYAAKHYHEANTNANPSHVSDLFRFQNNQRIPETEQNNNEGPYLPIWQMTTATNATTPTTTQDSMLNYNLLSHPVFSRTYQEVVRVGGRPLLSEVIDLNFLSTPTTSYLQHDNKEHDDDDGNHPHSFLFQPIFQTFLDDDDNNNNNNNKNTIVGFIVSIFPWDSYFQKILPRQAQGIHVVLVNTCDEESYQQQAFTYFLNGTHANYVGRGNLHDPQYDDWVVTTTFEPHPDEFPILQKEGHCIFEFQMYPTRALRDLYTSSQPVTYTCVVVVLFLLTSLAFIMYDRFVQKRQTKVMATAKRSNALISSLFPANVRDRIMKEAGKSGFNADNYRTRTTKNTTTSTTKKWTQGKDNLKSFLDQENVSSAENHKNHRDNDNDDNDGDDENGLNVFGSKPIADLFPDATVMFADLVGFTAWSSVREPSQVFQLLETLYHAFDEIARRRRVFKVETIGDCYVAVAGLPDPRPDHVVVMARFARDCMVKANDLAKKLEVTLGPDTGDLCMRIGMNSGPVTAGVLRGEKSRFQLFGDTVNTAARMESHGIRNKIHISQSTADLLCKANKSHWVTAREEKVFAKGKGDLQTYWIDLKIQSSPSAISGGGATESSSTHDTDHPPMLGLGDNNNNKQQQKQQTINVSPQLETTSQQKKEMICEEKVKNALIANNNNTDRPLLSDKVERLVSWNCDVLKRLLKQVVARRRAIENAPPRQKQQPYYAGESSTSLGMGDSSPTLTLERANDATVLDEVKEIITLPKFDAIAARGQENVKKIELDADVVAQLHDYVTVIATMYRDNPFHNFEHASHVTMSVVKLLSRIVAPDLLSNGVGDNEEEECSEFMNKNLHDHTYGITSDPLTQFAVVFSALIHDVDHSGVPNAQLVKENSSIATAYKNKSVAEQNSVDIAWDLLMDDSFRALRSEIYTNQSELKRFRQLVVNAVMATDIVDKELKGLRNARWEKAFQEKDGLNNETRDDVNRKATIVIEHLIQASDVAHTMQHWHIYRKWNERFFQEQLHAYQCGRAEQDPSDSWYQGEIGFFDFYIIPLAKKLKDCGVFGVSSDEYLDYAMANRKEWQAKGEEVVAEMIGKYRKKRFSYVEDQCKLGDDKKAGFLASLAGLDS